MFKVSKNDIISDLSKDYVRNCNHIVDIEAGGKDFYRSENNNDYFIIYKFGEKNVYEVISNDEYFFDECLKHIVEHNLNLSELYVIKQNFLNHPQLINKYNILNESSYSEYIFIDKCSDYTENLTIRQLTKDDITIAKKLKLEEMKGRPSFEKLFNVFVINEQGIVYAIEQNEEIIAYLSCYNTYANIYKIDHIYVIPSKRGLNYGVELVKKYTSDTTKKGNVPIYGAATNKFSEKVAEKAGYTKTYTYYTCIIEDKQ